MSLAASTPLTHGKVGSNVALGSARLLALAADPAHLKVLNMLILFLFRLTLLTLVGHLPECVGGIPLEVLLRSAAGAQSEIYI